MQIKKRFTVRKVGSRYHVVDRVENRTCRSYPTKDSAQSLCKYLTSAYKEGNAS